MTTCLICDDHALVREALAGTVRMAWPEMRILEAGDFPSAWALARSGPDICLADLVMPGALPLAGIEGIMRAAPDAKVLVITGTEDDALMLDLLERGVAGFVPKSMSGDIIEAALRLILAGGRYMPPRLIDLAASGVPRLAVANPPAPAPALDRLRERLSDRQIAVLRLMATGQSNKEIARDLGLAPSTIKTHVGHILLCLQAQNRTDAVAKARSANLV